MGISVEVAREVDKLINSLGIHGFYNLFLRGALNLEIQRLSPTQIFEVYRGREASRY
jgi:hypothetical protein